MTSFADTSSILEATQLPIASPDGLHIASFCSPYLHIRDTRHLDVIRSISITSRASAKYLNIRWSPAATATGQSNRILYADDETVRVWDLHDIEWSATLDNGTGNMGKLMNVEFGADDTEVLVFSAFGSKANVWSLTTGSSVEFRDPKFAFKGHGRNQTGRHGVFALLSRSGPHDSVTLHMTDAYTTIRNIKVPSSDAQGLKWSPDGRWFVVWDTPSIGYKIFIYTADGHLYRTYNGDCYQDDLAGLGVRTIAWCPSGDCLAIGNYERGVTLLSTRTFSPAVNLAHKCAVQLSDGVIWQESALSSMERKYNAIDQLFIPPMASLDTCDSGVKTGISILEFNAGGTHLATKDESMPTTIWIWDLTRLKATAVIVQHSTVQRLLWHPVKADLLLIQCAQQDTILYLWTVGSEHPKILQLPERRLSRKTVAQWIYTGARQKPTLSLGDTHGFLLGFLEVQDCLSPTIKATQPDLQGRQSTDSLFEVLSGRTGGSQAIDKSSREADRGNEDRSDTVHDTFGFRYGVKI